MAPRITAAMSSDDLDHHLESSPDPLAGSINETRAKPKRKSTRSTKQPLASSSPSKQNRRASITEAEFSSPSKSMVLSTPGARGQSPWRIKVTVQAEPGSDDENMESPSVKRVTRTRTTTVPLKDADAPSPVKRRGRPRKSDVTPATTKTRRNGTPVRRRAKSKPRDSSIGADASAADVDTDAPPKRRRGRPRKSIQPAAEDDEIMAANEREVSCATTHTSSSVQAPVLDKTSPPSSTDPNPASSRKAEESTNFTSSQFEPAHKIRTRRRAPAHNGNSIVNILSDQDSDEPDIHTPSDTEEEAQGQIFTLPAKGNGGDGLDLNQVYHSEEDEEDDGLQDVTNFAFEGATRMPDDTIILESENFSMVSVDSLPSSGGLTSPAAPFTQGTPAAEVIAVNHKQDYLEVPQPQTRSVRREMSDPSPNLSPGAPPVVQVRSSPRAAPPRYKTPSLGQRSPSNPPPIELAQPSPTEAQTPRIGRVVTAGVALQGVLEPSRSTPETRPSKIRNERQDQLDDLFRGFSDRTRKELQAGLLLGEQLAQDGPSNLQSPSYSNPTKAKSPVEPTEASSVPSSKHKSRLLTPEDSDDKQMDTNTTIQLADVQYPSLNVGETESHLPSPARSEDEMSWRVDTPPVPAATAERRRFVSATTERDFSIGLVQQQPHNQDQHADMWQEEAVRTADSGDNGTTADKLPLLEDIFDQDGPIRPPRGKLPRTWRRKSSGDFQYSDEAEESPQEPTPPSTESDESSPPNTDKGKGIVVEPVIMEELQDEGDDMSEASDDTGMFFQSNMPNLFNKKRTTEHRRRKAQKVDLSSLMNEGESLLPESSPAAAGSKTPANNRVNPFLNTPPQFTALRSSPAKSSPLRQEIRTSDISSDSIHQGFEESTLPVAPSSPFHTQVDGDTMLSTASDQQQLFREMARSTDSSLRRIRIEADDYLDAYEPQERSLNQIEEVTEHSRSWNQETTMMPSSPPAVRQTFEESMLNPKRAYAPLFSAESTTTIETASSNHAKATGHSQKPVGKMPIVAVAPKAEAEQGAQSSRWTISNLTTNLWGALCSSTPSPLPPHPIIQKFDPLPKVEPWTKTHYKTLDALYQLHKKDSMLYSMINYTNSQLLTHFLDTSPCRFVGATYSSWGYKITMNESLVVLCAAYTQLLTLQDISEYERVAGKEIQMGDCGPGVAGEKIEAEEVVRRLATVIMGEKLRKDEKRGKTIVKEGGMTIEWPA